MKNNHSYPSNMEGFSIKCREYFSSLPPLLNLQEIGKKVQFFFKKKGYKSVKKMGDCGLFFPDSPPNDLIGSLKSKKRIMEEDKEKNI